MPKRAYFYYSVLKATTGSFLAALLAGIKPAIDVSTTLNEIITSALTHVRLAILVTIPPEANPTIILPITDNINVTNTPNMMLNQS